MGWKVKPSQKPSDRDRPVGVKPHAQQALGCEEPEEDPGSSDSKNWAIVQTATCWSLAVYEGPIRVVDCEKRNIIAVYLRIVIRTRE